MAVFDGEKFGAEVVAAVKQYLTSEIGALAARIDAIEARSADPVERVSPDEVQSAIDGLNSKLAEMKADVASALEAVPAMISGEVEKAVALIPRPQDGASVTADDIRPIVADEVKSAVSAIPPAADGVGVAGAIIDRSGSLILTLTDGSTKDLGAVVGKDAEAGPIIDKVMLEIDRKFASIEPPKDGLGFEHMDEYLDEDGRTIVRRYQRGDEVKEFRHTFPVVVDRGTWKKGEFERGDGVTWGGSYWIAQRKTSQKPDTPNSGWRMAVKRGSDAYQPAKV